MKEMYENCNFRFKGKSCEDCPLKCKGKECELQRLKQENEFKNELLAKLGCPTTATAKRKVFVLEEQIKQLKQENERLQMLSCANCGEKYLSPDGAELYEKNVQLQEENEKLKEKNKSIAKDYIDVFGDYQKYKKALEEIKNIAELDVCYNAKLDKYTFNTYAQRILDTIKEVLKCQQ